MVDGGRRRAGPEERPRLCGCVDGARVRWRSRPGKLRRDGRPSLRTDGDGAGGCAECVWTRIERHGSFDEDDGGMGEEGGGRATIPALQLGKTRRPVAGGAGGSTIAAQRLVRQRRWWAWGLVGRTRRFEQRGRARY